MNGTIRLGDSKPREVRLDRRTPNHLGDRGRGVASDVGVPLVAHIASFALRALASTPQRDLVSTV